MQRIRQRRGRSGQSWRSHLMVCRRTYRWRGMSRICSGTWRNGTASLKSIRRWLCLGRASVELKGRRPSPRRIHFPPKLYGTRRPTYFLHLPETAQSQLQRTALFQRCKSCTCQAIFHQQHPSVKLCRDLPTLAWLQATDIALLEVLRDSEAPTFARLRPRRSW